LRDDDLSDVGSAGRCPERPGESLVIVSHDGAIRSVLNRVEADEDSVA
jgi:hypothetical protein